ncbi:sigma-70 family RNA polymerase sigma factor [Paenibacillus koleovorans]|uniref:sigma-70 family RNA polymerase sigma factor n=1 Tax=Paenibacillus koleovorans TaxID=121608 RepID=UPI000FDB7594|nr:sigma-70 family RNA polymerase sigma factor [Paenibacillus koleovorans]
MSSGASSQPQPDIQNLLRLYQESESNNAATALLLHYEPVVRMAAGKMSRSRPDLYEDLFQVGQMSMLRLFKQYDATLGIPFEAYAMKCLIGHLKNYLRDKSWYIQVPRRVKEKGLLVQQMIDELTLQLERSPKVEEIAAKLELSEEETIEILAGRDYYHYTSLDTPLSSEGDGATIGDMLSVQEDEYEALEKRMDLSEAMEQLKPEEQQVLALAYREGYSQRYIADQLGVSQMSVSRIQKRAIGKLREWLEDDSGR